MLIFAKNKKANFDYIILETITVGIVLHGYEIKSIRLNQINLTGSYAVVDSNTELMLLNCNISRYKQAFKGTTETENRTRKLLANKKEILKLQQMIISKRVTLIPLTVFQTEKSKVKIILGVAKHKKSYERKEDLKEKDINRETRRELKGKYTY